MVHSLYWEAYSRRAGQEIPRILWNPKVHYCLHKSSQLISSLRQMNPVNTYPTCFSKSPFNAILSSMPLSSNWSLPFTFSNQNFVYIFYIPVRATCPNHLIFLYLITLTVFGKAYKLRSSSLCNLLRPPAISSLLGPVSSSAPCSQTPEIYVLPLVWETKYHNNR